jgi:iduronate 2-sulfatase
MGALVDNLVNGERLPVRDRQQDEGKTMRNPIRSRFVLWCLASVLLVVLGSREGLRAADGAARKLNVLFLVCDDLNCDIGCYGHRLVKTPHIDRLAKRGVRFSSAYCQFPLCGPSRASFLTGMYPDQTLVLRNAIYIREHIPNVVTLPQMFRRNGYFATRIGKMYHYNVPKHIGTSGHDDPYSWNQTFNPRGRDVDEESKIFSLRKGQFGGTLSWLAAEGTDEEQTDGIAATRAIEMLEQHASSGTPFFLAVGLFRPHTPYVAPKKYFEMYPTKSIRVPTVPEGYFESLPPGARQTLLRKKDQVNLADSVAREAIQAYYASITFADAQIGRILGALKSTGLDKNTVVLFTSDHGYHMGEHGHYQKTTLFENADRVPLVIAGPGVTAGGEVHKGPVEMVDFYKTLADLCGLKAPGTVTGVSLAAALKDSSASIRTSALTQYGAGYSLRTSRYRYTEWGEGGQGGSELYDRASDPDELINLASQESHKATRERLSELLSQRVAAAKQKPKGLVQIPFNNRRRVR